MFLPVLRKEILSHILSLRFGVTFILFILLVFASIYVTTHEYQRDMAQAAARERAAAAQLSEVLKEKALDDRVYRLIEWEGRMDAVPVQPLSAIAQGLRPSTPVAMRTTAREFKNVGHGAERNPLAGLLRAPDLVYVVSVILSLLAVLFAFDSICGEKESGTLRLVLSNAVPRDSILLAKWVGGYLVLIIPFLIAALGGLGYAWWQGSLELTGDNVKRLAALLCIACLYISVFFTLSLFISTVTHRAVTALFVCLLVWVLWILAVPNLAPVVAKIIAPTPSLEKINAEKRAVDQEIRLRINRLTITSGELSYGAKVREEQQRLFEEGDRQKQQWDRFLERTSKRQTALAETFGRLSPSVSWTYSAVALANTGPDAYRQFEFSQRKLAKDMENLASRLRQQRRKAGAFPAVEAGDVPHLQVAWPPFAAAARYALNDVLILVILNVIFFLAAFVSFLRYDVR